MSSVHAKPGPTGLNTWEGRDYGAVNNIEYCMQCFLRDRAAAYVEGVIL